MREIKFRAWDKENKKMYFQLNESPCFGLFEGNRAVSIEDVFFYEKQNFELMQYTGIKDKNGHEIYEGDILELYIPDWSGSHDIQRVAIKEYCTDVSDLQVIVKNCEECLLDGGNDYVEVVGNVYENPELLEESQNGTK